MEYAEFDTERRRIIRSVGREITDAAQLEAAVERLREQAATLSADADRTRASEQLTALDGLLAEAAEPENEYVRRASEILQRSTAPEGTPAEQRTRAAAGMAEITRIAASAPTRGDRDAVLEMNEPLAVIVRTYDERAAPVGDDRGPGHEDVARFAVDRAVVPPGRITAPSSAPAARSTGSGGPEAQVRDR
ncbi:hypothetical protein ACFV9C_09315 [Kribbella sp. NPDC059898]|uniref:hypothetical protein n=1 Tax=Kribbella sp. NPDC059898 TaxID=3346995 RepID=UPI00365CE74C